MLGGSVRLLPLKLDARRQHQRFQHLPHRDVQFSKQKLLEIQAKIFGSKAGEKSQPTKVHAHQRNLFTPQAAGGREERAIAAQDEDHVRRHLLETCFSIRFNRDLRLFGEPWQ